MKQSTLYCKIINVRTGVFDGMPNLKNGPKLCAFWSMFCNKFEILFGNNYHQKCNFLKE